MTDLGSYEAGCVGKVSFEDPRRAKLAAGRRKNRRAYKCQHCRKWHVGNLPPRRKGE
jgi:hypothetical protein